MMLCQSHKWQIPQDIPIDSQEPCLPLHHELCVSFRSGDDHIHPDPHGLGRGGHHVVHPVMSLNAEGQGGVRALKENGLKWGETAQKKKKEMK